MKGLERQCLASCRLQEAGSREIVCAPVLALMEYGVDAGIAREEKQTYLDFLNMIYSSIDDQESLEQFKAFGKLQKVSLRAGQFLYVPMGWLILERTLGDVNAYGYRTAAFDATAQSVANFNTMRTQLEAIAGKEDPLVKSWAAVAAKLPS